MHEATKEKRTPSKEKVVRKRKCEQAEQNNALLCNLLQGAQVEKKVPMGGGRKNRMKKIWNEKKSGVKVKNMFSRSKTNAHFPDYKGRAPNQGLKIVRKRKKERNAVRGAEFADSAKKKGRTTVIMSDKALRSNKWGRT